MHEGFFWQYSWDVACSFVTGSREWWWQRGHSSYEHLTDKKPPSHPPIVILYWCVVLWGLLHHVFSSFNPALCFCLHEGEVELRRRSLTSVQFTLQFIIASCYFVVFFLRKLKKMGTDLLSLFSRCVAGSTLSVSVRVVLQLHRGREAGNAARSAQRTRG